MKFKARAYRSRHKPGTMNQTEALYCAHLELLKKSGEILDYSFECETLKIGKDCRYTPDFRVLRFSYENPVNGAPISIIEFHEVKGTVRKKRKVGLVHKENDCVHKQIGLVHTKPFIEDDALVKIKAAAELHPYKFILVWKGLNGQWEKREIN